MQIIEQFIETGKKNIKLAKAYQNSSPLQQGLFFYHIPKTGGISFFQSLAQNILLMSKNGKLTIEKYAAINQNGLIGRYDKPYETLSAHEKNNYFSQIPIAFATHQAFGFHKHFINSSPLLTTVIREPFSRIKSNYIYQCSRQDKEVSLEGFKEYIHNEKNINLMARLLSNSSESEGSAQKSINNLTEHFHSYVPLQSLDKLQEYYLTLFGLSNVISDKLNTSGHYQKTQAQKLDTMKEEALSLNQEDLLLYNYVKDNERIPEINKESLSPYITIVNETSNTDKVNINFHFAHLQKMKEVIQEYQPTTLSSIITHLGK